MEFIAHIREKDRHIQSVKEHLLRVKELAETYGLKIGVSHIAGLAGLLHDLGKYTVEFRNYILEAVANPDAPPKRGSVDHSTAGGKLLNEWFHKVIPPDRNAWMLAEVVGNAIISHHSYLHDFLNNSLESDYLRRVRDKELPGFHEAMKHFFADVMSEADFRIYVREAAREVAVFLQRPFPGSYESKLMFLTKFVFSALIDADRTNTRMFEADRAAEPELDHGELFRGYYEKLMMKINGYQTQDQKGASINRLRREMSDRCEEFADKESGIYTLSIPTGGGKTLASFRYALQHAIRHKKKHIVYVVPYTTIIEQNAEEIRRIIQDDAHLLEHHSNVVDDQDDEDEDEDGRINVRQKLKLAKDNWDSPIVFTTMVQFLNVFYAKGSRNIRRLHNMCEAVVVFDEVQKVPTRCVSLFNQALNFLKAYGNSSLVLCTATQPELNYVEHKLDIAADAEIVEQLDQVIQAFKRVEILDKATDETFNNGKLADFIEEQLEKVQSVLVILNTKTVVKRLYDQLKIDGVPKYHLSTSMCAAHRNRILGQVKEHLANREKVVCISTQLIEAGVDVSFDCVIRSLAGLDSIAQAAGRCNRHGLREVQQVYVIDHEEENLKHLGEIRAGKQEARKILIDLKRDPNSHGGHLLSVQAMSKYFKEFYSAFESDLNYPVLALRKSIVDLLTMSVKHEDSYARAYAAHNRNAQLPLFITNSYRTAAEHFQVIDSLTISVIVPYGEEGKEIIARLNGNESIEDLSRLLRKVQQYTINLFRYERDSLAKNDGIVSLLNGKVWALKESAYNEKFGLDLDNDGGFEFGMI
ncbi:CRISPR-associated helicase Cas3' [Paenibacillus koleovorans]|uniref:CRISPR-associated helicase Cas3' n=1 Tax=Paenibacillus koleovorans TaxID=121608 RepID=UPI000FD99635|nr:CRISPR-associated helicase Cas3' [Paenibacillus koleovorans]